MSIKKQLFLRRINRLGKFNDLLGNRDEKWSCYDIISM